MFSQTVVLGFLGIADKVQCSSSMVRFSQLLTNWLRAVRDPRFYHQVVPSWSWWQFWQTVLVGVLVVSALWAGWWYFASFPALKAELQEETNRLVEWWPDNLSVNWTGQQLEFVSTPQQEFRFSIGISYLTEIGFSQIVVQTELIEQVDAKLAQGAFLVVTPTQAWLQQTQTNWQPVELRSLQLPPTEITAATIEQQVSNLNQELRVVLSGVQVLSVMASPLILLVRVLTTAVINASLIWLIRKLWQPIPWTTLFRWSMLLATVGQVVAWVSIITIGSVGFDIGQLSFWILLLWVLWTKKG